MGTISYRTPTVEEIAVVLFTATPKPHKDDTQPKVEDYKEAAQTLLDTYIIQERVKDRKPIQTAKSDDKIAE